MGARPFSMSRVRRSLPKPAGRSSEDAHEHRGQQGDQRGADDVEDALPGVVGVVDHDVDQRLGEHQDDRQQDRGEGGAEARALLQVLRGALGDHPVRGRDVHPAGRDLREQRAGDDHRRYGHQHAERERHTEVGLHRVDRDQGSGVRRDQAVHHGETGEGRDADAHQGVVAALGDHQHDRDQQHDADLEEQRQTDDGGDQDHRPRHRTAARLREDRVDDLVGAARVGEHLAEDRTEGDQHADAGDGGAEAGGEAGDGLVERRSGDRAEHERAQGQRQEGVQPELGDEQDDDGDARQYGDAQLSVTGRGDRLRCVRCQHLDAESGHGGPLQVRGEVLRKGVKRGVTGARRAPSRPAR